MSYISLKSGADYIGMIGKLFAFLSFSLLILGTARRGLERQIQEICVEKLGVVEP